MLSMKTETVQRVIWRAKDALRKQLEKAGDPV